MVVVLEETLMMITMTIITPFRNSLTSCRSSLDVSRSFDLMVVVMVVETLMMITMTATAPSRNSLTVVVMVVMIMMVMYFWTEQFRIVLMTLALTFQITVT